VKVVVKIVTINKKQTIIMNIEQYAYIRKRKEQLKFWSVIGFLVLVVIIFVAVWMFFNSPLLIIPFEAITKVEQGILQQPTLEMMALFMPILVIMLFVVMFAFVFIMFKAHSNEKKYLSIIDELMN
jgi:amino acid transporter